MARPYPPSETVLYKLSDGRTLIGTDKLFVRSPDKFIVKGGVITGVFCNRHGWQTPDEYYIITSSFVRRSGPRTQLLLCVNCKREDYSPKGRRGLRSESIEDRITVKDALEGKECTSCHIWKPLVDYRKKKRENGNRYYAGACRRCLNDSAMLRSCRGRIREVFGEDSTEYRFAKNEKRYRYLQAVCWVLGLFSNRGILSEKLRPVQRVLSRMPPEDSREFATFWRSVEDEVQEIQERRARAPALAVLYMPPVQAPYRFL